MFLGTWYLTNIDGMYRRKYERTPLHVNGGGDINAANSIATVARI